MERKTVAIVGFGDLGERLVRRLHPQRWRCLGLRRNAHAVPAGVEGIAVDLHDAATLRVLESRAPDALLITLSPGERSAAGYRQGFHQAMEHILAGLGRHRPERIFFVSSTRVYAEEGGAWVDEDSPLAFADPRAKAIIDAEAALRDFSASAVVLRAGGLYGAGPGYLLKRVSSGHFHPREPLQYGNRVHRDDVAAFLAATLPGGGLAGQALPGVINLVDDAPVPLQEVESWLADALGCPYRPPAEASGPARHKRVRNTRLRATAYELLFGDYRAGYGDVLHRWMAHSDREDGLDLH